MKKKLFIINVVSFMLIALFAAGSCYAATKKVLVLQIIEENWDDLEFSLPKYKAPVGGGPTSITKIEALNNYKESKSRMMLKDKKSKKVIRDRIVLSDSKGVLSKNTRYCVRHEIYYLGKAYLISNTEKFAREAFRLGSIGSTYFYEAFPNKISLLGGPRGFNVTRDRYDPIMWSRFMEIRLVDDLNIISSDKIGNLKIKYADKEYDSKVDSIVELPIKEQQLQRDEMIRFKERYYEYYAKEYNWAPKGYFRSNLIMISSQKEIFHFGTKVTLINYGFMELSGD